MKGRISIRIGGCRALGESGGSETLGDGGGQQTVILLRLISEPEESEEDERGDDGSPPAKLYPNHENGTMFKNHRRILRDTGVVLVDILPGDPWIDRVRGGDHDEIPNDNWEGKDEVERSQHDETPVAVVGQRAIGGDESLELPSPLHEGIDSEGWRREGPN